MPLEPKLVNPVLRIAKFSFAVYGFLYAWLDVAFEPISLWTHGSKQYTRATTRRLIHHGDRGAQYLSIHYAERLAEAAIEPSVGRVGDSYDNALAETVIGLYKTELIHRRGPWRHFEAVEFRTLEWIDWFNNRRLFAPIGNVPPAEFERAYYRDQEEQVACAGVN